MKLFDYLKPECVMAHLKTGDKKGIIREIADIALKSPSFKEVDAQTIISGILKREELGSTGFGGGIAIPHCRLDNVNDFLVGLITVPEGVDFDAMDGEKVKVFVFIIAPLRESNEHLRILSAISRVLKIPGVQDELLSAKTADALRESFLRHARDDVDTKGHTNKHIFHVFIQDEDVFKELLNIFASMESTSVTVIESRNSREYLAKMPLFSGLWSDSYMGFSRLIIAAVDKTMTNETIRQIESITGRLDECGNVMVAIQEVFYAAGSLDP